MHRAVTRSKPERSVRTGPSGTPAANGRTYVVRSGETLSAIATRLGVRGGWQALYERNRHVVGGNPNLILPGQRLAL
jgi:nucleoid-associated protein YgaU